MPLASKARKVAPSAVATVCQIAMSKISELQPSEYRQYGIACRYEPQDVIRDSCAERLRISEESSALLADVKHLQRCVVNLAEVV